MFENMEPRTFAAIGTASICLLAGTIGSLPGVWRAAPGLERRNVAAWSGVFILNIVTFSIAVCLLPLSLFWLLPLPLLAVVVGVNKANRRVAPLPNLDRPK